MEPKILFEDKSILVVDKPAGWVVNRAKSVKRETIQDWICRDFHFPISNLQSLRNGIVHRLDKETSGILVVAKTKTAFRALQTQFKQRKVQKTYIALVHGTPRSEEGIVSAPVGRLPWNRERFGVLPGGRTAETEYKILKAYEILRSNKRKSTRFKPKQPTRLNEFKHGNSSLKKRDNSLIVYSLLELHPKTGRTHQIRIHLKHLGHPIVADEFYAGRKTARADRKWCPRLFLHAGGISFAHPESGKAVSYKSELPNDLSSCLKKLVKL